MSQSSLDTCKQQPLMGSKLGDNIDNLANSMGLNQVCRQRADASASQGEASIGVNSILGGARASASFNKSSQSMASEGCGQFFLNAQEYVESESNINCLIQRNETNASIAVSARQSITLETLPLSDEQRKDLLALNRLQLEVAAGVGADKITPAFSNLVQYQLDTYNRDVNITGSRLVQTSNISVKTLGEFSSSQISDIESQYKRVTDSVVRNNVEVITGVAALSPNIREAITSAVERNTRNASEKIKSTLTNIKIDVSSSQGITIKAPGKINLINSSLEQDTLINLATELIVTDAVTAAVKTVADIRNSLSIERDIKTDSKGMEDIIFEQGESKKKGLEAGAPAEISSFAYIAIIVIAIIVIGAAYFYFTRGPAGVASNFIPRGPPSFPPAAPPLS